MTEREKLQSWRIFLGGCEQEFAKALRDLSLMPPHHRAHAEETIQELTASPPVPIICETTSLVRLV